MTCLAFLWCLAHWRHVGKQSESVVSFALFYIREYYRSVQAYIGCFLYDICGHFITTSSSLRCYHYTINYLTSDRVYRSIC